MTISRPKRAAIWARVSTEEQHTSNQVQQLQEWAAKRDLEVVQVYEVQESAWRGGHHPALVRVLQDAHQGLFDVLLVWALDRLSREGVIATFDVINRLGNAEVQVLSFQEPWTDVPGEFRWVMLSIAAWIANSESERRSARTKAGMAKVKNAGRPSLAKGVYCGRCRRAVPSTHFQGLVGHRARGLVEERFCRVLPKVSGGVLSRGKAATFCGVSRRTFDRMFDRMMESQASL